MATITTTALRARWRGADRWLSDGGARGAGRLTARITRDGTLLYFQYFNDGKLQRVPLGPYDEAGTRGLSLPAARDRAAELAALYRSGTTDLLAHLRREQEAREAAAREAEESARRAEEEKQRGTLRQLLEAYTRHLERNGKQSAADARSILTRHVLEAAPDLAGRKAAELVEHRRFRAAYDFLLLREQAGEDTAELGAFWTEVQQLSPQQRLEKMSGGKGGGRRRSRKPRTRPAP